MVPALSSLTVPYLPHQRVLVFHADLTSGDTLGYHGTIVRLHASSLRRYPDHSERWVYRVFIPCLGRQVDVSSIDLFATGGLDASPLPSECETKQPACELRFDSQTDGDSNQIDGAYRMPSRKWVRFRFRKSDQPLAEYKLSFKLKGFHLGSGHLCYNVPATERLDRQFVLRAIAEIIGVEKPQGCD